MGIEPATPRVARKEHPKRHKLRVFRAIMPSLAKQAILRIKAHALVKCSPRLSAESLARKKAPARRGF